MFGRLIVVATILTMVVGCGGSGTGQQSNGEAECRDLGSIRKPVALIGGKTDPTKAIRAFRRSRTPSDVIPRIVRARFNEVAAVGSFDLLYAKSRRITTLLDNRNVDTYAVPTSLRGLCFGFKSTTLASDCVRGLMRDTGTWIMAANSCLPQTSSFVGLAIDPVVALEVMLPGRTVRVPVVNNVALWRPGPAVRRASEVQRVTAIMRGGRRIDL